MKVGDLGIARVLENTLDQCKSVVGTPYYMAPEGVLSEAIHGIALAVAMQVAHDRANVPELLGTATA